MKEVADLHAYLVLGEGFLSLAWIALYITLWPLFRFCVRLLRRRWLRGPDATRLLVREVVISATLPILGFFLAWPGLDAQLASVGLRLVALFFLLPWLTDRSRDDFSEDEVNALHERYDPLEGYCSNCGRIDEDFKYCVSNFVSKIPSDAASGEALRSPTDTWLCRRCSGSDRVYL